MGHDTAASEPRSASDLQEHHDTATEGAAADERRARPGAGETPVAAQEEPGNDQAAATKTRSARREDILTNAHDRDDQADFRDVVADDRDRTASLQSFLHHDEYDAGHRARRAAALDRQDSKADRVSAAEDRTELSEHGRDT